MPTGNEAYTTFDRGWIVRIQPPANPSFARRCLLLLHGWLGDETVMWIFTRNVPANTWIFAPRAPLQSDEGGYGWLPHAGSLPNFKDFVGVAGTFITEFQRWRTEAGVLPQTPTDIMGFSQGAGMSYALAALYPEQFERVVALAGFLPKEEPLPGRYASLKGKSIYVAHGSRDETIPVSLAQQAVRTLQSAGAQVTYCESDVGHKLSADCLRGLNKFLLDASPLSESDNPEENTQRG